MSDAFADAGRLRQELDSVWKMHDALKRENVALRAENERLKAEIKEAKESDFESIQMYRRARDRADAARKEGKP